MYAIDRVTSYEINLVSIEDNPGPGDTFAQEVNSKQNANELANVERPFVPLPNRSIALPAGPALRCIGGRSCRGRFSHPLAARVSRRCIRTVVRRHGFSVHILCVLTLARVKKPAYIV